MSVSTLPDQRFWEEYWHAKDVVRVVTERERFYPLLHTSVRSGDRSFVELGGYPGLYAVLARKLLGLEATLVDIVVDESPIHRLLGLNGLTPADVEVVHEDLFSYRPERGYDVVFSTGLVEHFEDLDAIVGAHAALARPGGTVVVTVPNFRGVNGLVQLAFDRSNLAAHDLAAMRPDRLARAAAAAGLEQIETFYYGPLEIWLEQLGARAFPLRALVRTVNAVGRRLPPPRARLASPHLVLRARVPGA